MYTKRTNNRFTDLIREQAVLDVIDNKQSLCEVSRQFGTDHSVIRQWVSSYKRYGKNGFHLGKRHYSVEFKLDAIKALKDNHLSLHQAALEFGINVSVLRSWRHKYETYGLRGLELVKIGRPSKMQNKKPQKPKTVKSPEGDLLRELHLLQVENAYLKKLHALIQERIARENGNGQEPSRD